MLNLTQNYHHFRATLELAELSENQSYVIGDQLRAKLSVQPKRNLNAWRITGQLLYVIKGKNVSSLVKAHWLKLMPYTELKKGEIYDFDIKIPFQFGRPNLIGKHLNNFWQFSIEIVHEVISSSPILKQFLPSGNRMTVNAAFNIPVSTGNGNFRVSPRTLPIPLIRGEVVGIAVLLTPVLILVFNMWQKETSMAASITITLAVLLAIIGYHFLRLSSFKITPMEIKPQRDGKIKIHYLNRGKDHFKEAFVGIRLKERYIKASNGNQYCSTAIIHEGLYELSNIARPLGHLNEVSIPWPKDAPAYYPTGYQSGNQGYEWEAFLKVPGLILGGYNEIKWPIRVDWERMRTTLPSPHELEEEKLQLRELADNRLKS